MQKARVIEVPGQARYLVPFSARRLPHLFAKVLVLGSGIAGLRAALAAAEKTDVLVVTKATASESNTRYAQGGIAAPIPPGDSVDDHVQDTITAGAGLCDAKVVRDVIRSAPEAMRELISWGTRFDARRGRLDFAKEGGHGRARVLHAGGDATGEEVERVLLDRARNHPRITILERTFAIDLFTWQDPSTRPSAPLGASSPRASEATRGVVVGALVWDPVNGLRAISSAAAILATGGAGQLWRETTNPEVATGDGLAVAFRAGAVMADLEFMQFHPTTLYLAGATRALISEAVRGEGAYLRDRKGVRFMTDAHPLGELAPRDVVSRGIV
ncbi:MAG: FAD-binding protein, partial [Planctomycetota bacterium]